MTIHKRGCQYLDRMRQEKPKRPQDGYWIWVRTEAAAEELAKDLDTELRRCAGRVCWPTCKKFLREKQQGKKNGK